MAASFSHWRLMSLCFPGGAVSRRRHLLQDLLQTSQDLRLAVRVGLPAQALRFEHQLLRLELQSFESLQLEPQPLRLEPLSGGCARPHMQHKLPDRWIHLEDQMKKKDAQERVRPAVADDGDAELLEGRGQQQERYLRMQEYHDAQMIVWVAVLQGAVGVDEEEPDHRERCDHCVRVCAHARVPQPRRREPCQQQRQGRKGRGSRTRDFDTGQDDPSSSPSALDRRVLHHVRRQSPKPG
mmetsp:Transcript_3112/g.8588  ORF Transcript_3112/g.8588 Transcript_3112/m.8588 type:complete len:239 (+) Transcript_3112:86-802(+)